MWDYFSLYECVADKEQLPSRGYANREPTKAFHQFSQVSYPTTKILGTWKGEGITE